MDPRIRNAGAADNWLRYHNGFALRLIKDHIKIILLSAVAILLLVLVITITNRSKQVPDNTQLIQLYDRLIAAKDSTILLQQEIKQDLKEQLAVQYQRDTMLIKALVSNQPKYVTNEKKYNQIPVVVGSLSKDELRREFAGY